MNDPTAAAASSQRRHIAILFSDMSDSTRIAATMEPELYADLLQTLRDLVGVIVPRHGGEIVRVDGDGLLCIFGYPQSYEDAGRRATEAALDIHAAVAALDTGGTPGPRQIRMHSGVHAGVVLLRAGDVVRGRYELLGDATNVAARLCDHAPADGIVVSESTLGSDRHLFDTGARRAINVSGHAAPVAVFDVRGRKGAATRYAARLRSGLTPFAGRDDERARMAAWLTGGGGTAGAPGPAIPVMLMHGPAGIGKTRFIDQIVDDARRAGWRVAQGYCESYLSARPLQPFLQLAETLAGPDAAANAERLPDTMPPLVDEALTRAPLLLVIDDWQWADDASRRLLAQLLQVPREDPRLRVLLASRGEDSGLPQDLAAQLVATTALPPLDHAASEKAIATLLPTRGPFTVARIEAAAGGSPLLIEELCHAWQAAGNNDGPPSLFGATDVRGAWYDLAVQTRFAALADDDARLLRLAAVIGHMVPMSLLAAVHGAPVDPAQLARLQAADFLFPGDVGDVVRFKHGLTRDAIYAGIGLSDRRALHARVLDAIEAEAEVQGEAGRLDALAYHSAAADRRASALPYAIRAGDAALAAGALDRAQAHYRVGFALVAQLSDGTDRRDYSWALLNKFGIASLVDPAPDQIAELEAVGRLFKARRDVPGMIRTAYWQGAIAYGIGQGKTSVAHLREALALATAHGEQRFVTQIQTKLAQSLFASGEYAAAAELFTAVLPAIRETRTPNDREALAYALSCCAFMYADIGDFAASDALYDEQEAVQPAESTPVLAPIVGQRSAVRLWRGEYAAALELAEINLKNSLQTGARYQTMMGHALAAYARFQLGEHTAAVDALHAAARWFVADSSSSQRTSLVHGWLADVLAETGDRRAARHAAAHAVQRVRHGGDRLGEGMAWRALARIEARAGNTERAAHYNAMAVKSADVRGSQRERAEAALCAAELAQLRGDADGAAAMSAAARAAFEAMAMPQRAADAAAFIPSR